MTNKTAALLEATKFVRRATMTILSLNQLIPDTMRLFAVILLIVMVGFTSSPEPFAPCRVRLPDLAGSYEGDCHKGKAHGTGKAIGRDIYEGEFAKGWPHGTGTYTWANGDYYEGEFVKGSKEGQGKMVFASVNADSVQVGQWENDQFLGKGQPTKEEK